jgi:dTDP-4-dehydrorhamnose 3,5-epimerase
MEVVSLDIDDVKLVRPRRFADARGFFVETWNRKTFAAHGIDTDFVQDNYSRSHAVATIRGLHYQRPPAAQVKLVRVLAGSVFDVAVDMRKASPSYGRHVAVVLTAEGGEQLYVPVGFAHGFCTLEPNTEVAYKVSEFYSPENDAGIVWDDPDLGIAWPIGGKGPILSSKDQSLPRLKDAASPF